MTTRLMYDSVSPSRIPATATMVAGYVDGRYANIPALKKRFPHAVVVEIAVFAHTNAGVVLDVEKGDATPAEAPGWVTARRHAGVDPTVYCSASMWPAVRAAFANSHVAPPHWWIADYDGDPTIPAGAAAKQYQDGAAYDLSAVAAYWPGVDPAPKPTPAAKPKVSLKNLIAASHTDPTGRQGHTTHPADVKPVEAALHAEGLLAEQYATDGSFGTATITAYSRWQQRCGYTGAAANGIPGRLSLLKLGAKHGFTVTS